MTINDILLFIKDRTGQTDADYVFREVNRVTSELWLQFDPPGSLREMTVTPDLTGRIIILPWYVWQVKAARRGMADEITLYTPRAFYQDDKWQQYMLQWKFLEKTPLLKRITKPGRLKLRLRSPATAAFTSTVTGPGEFGVNQIMTASFGIGDTEQELSEVISDVVAWSKSAATAADLELYSIDNDKLGVLPSTETAVYNTQIQILSDCTQIATTPCNTVTVLYKISPPVYTDAKQAIPAELGQVLQNRLAADLFAKSGTDADARRMAFHGQQTSKLIRAGLATDNEGKLQRIGLTRAPHVHEFYGYL